MRPSIITQPDWERRPNGADLTELYPKSAANRSIEGTATIACHVNELGALVDCKAISESPAGEGFGDAAVAMAAKFKMRPQTKDGVPVAGGSVRIPIKFALPKNPVASAEIALRCYGYAAAEAERNPASESAQAATLAFGVIAQVFLAAEKARPSEVAQVYASQRATAATKLDDPVFKAERDQCAAALPPDAAAGMRKALGAGAR